jgi:hypothetical protein
MMKIPNSYPCENSADIQIKAHPKKVTLEGRGAINSSGTQRFFKMSFIRYIIPFPPPAFYNGLLKLITNE